jgi:hypothetical protein
VIDEVAVYNRALPVSEIQSHYNAGLNNKGYCDIEDTIYIDPLGDAVVEEITDGYLVSNIDDDGDDGISLSPEPAYEGVSTELNLNDITPGAKININYYSLTEVFSFGLTIGCEARGVYPVGFKGNSTGSPSCIGTLEGAQIFSYTFELGAASFGAFVSSEKGVYPVGFKGSSTGAPSIIKYNEPDGSAFTWKHDTETYVVDNVVIKHQPSPSYPIGIGRCDVLGTYQMDLLRNTGAFTIKNLYASNPANKPTINGPTSGKTGTEYPYTITTTDTNNDNVYYYVYYGDETTSGWIGPFTSGATATVKHTWSEDGTYTIRAKAKDTNGFESDWAELTVKMPRNTLINWNSIFMKVLERFPILEKILNLQ